MAQTTTTNFATAMASLLQKPIFLMAAHGRINSTLDGSITATGLSITLVNAASFPSEGVIHIEDGSFSEYVYYSSKSGNVLTVPETLGRASLATTAASHASGKTVRIVYVFTTGPVAGRQSNASFRMYLDKIDGFSQKITIEDGHSEIGTTNFQVLDRDEFVTSIIKDNDFAFRDKTIRFMVGYRDVLESDYLTIGTYRTREIKLDSTLTRYRWSGIDLQRALRDRILFGQTTLNTTMTPGSPANGGNIAVISTANFASAGHIRIGDEIIEYKEKDSTNLLLKDITRGDEGTTAAAHAIGDDIGEIFIIQGNPVTILLKFMLTINGDGVNHAFYDSLDATKGLGIDASLVDVTGFEVQRDTFLPGREYMFRLERDDVEDFLSWAESQINKTIPATFLIKGDGKLSYRVAGPVVLASDPIRIDEDDIIGNPEWDLGSRNVVNDITVKYDYNTITGKFEHVVVQINASSAAKHGESRKIMVESKGIRTSLDATSITARLFDYLDHRFAEPAPEAVVKVRLNNLDSEVSDGCLLSDRKVPDVRTGVRGVVDQQMEIAEASPNFNDGFVRMRLRDLNRSGKFAVIAPNLGLEDMVSAFPDYPSASARERRYAYIAVTATEKMSDGDPPSLII